MSDNAQAQPMRKPDPALKCLDKFVGTWEVQSDTLKISVAYGPVNATFHGKFSKAGNSFLGGWRPNPGADETVNVPYDVGVTG